MTLETVNTGETGQPIVVDKIDSKNVQASKILIGAQNTDGGYLGPDNPMPIGSPPSLPLPAGAATNAKLDELIAEFGPLATEATVEAVRLLLAAIQAATGSTPSATPQVVLQGAIRRDADTPWPGVDEGEVGPLMVNRDGRLKTAGAPAQFDAVTGSITANSQTVSADVTSVSNVVVQLTGTFATHNCTFEGSLDGGTSWVAIQGVRSNANTIELTTGSLSAAPAYAWEFSVNAYTNFRVRATSHGSGTANWRFTLGSYATEPIPAIQTHGITGTVTTAINAGTNAIGDVGLQVRANATGAASIHHIVSAGTTNVAQIKATAGRVIGYCLSNTNAAWRYVKLHNIASATAGAAVAVTIGIPPNGKAECMIPQGIGFATAISRSIVTGSADADNTAVGAGDVVGDIFFA
jgi:hypothetical protein